MLRTGGGRVDDEADVVTAELDDDGGRLVRVTVEWEVRGVDGADDVLGGAEDDGGAELDVAERLWLWEVVAGVLECGAAWELLSCAASVLPPGAGTCRAESVGCGLPLPGELDPPVSASAAISPPAMIATRANAPSTQARPDRLGRSRVWRSSPTGSGARSGAAPTPGIGLLPVAAMAPVAAVGDTSAGSGAANAAGPAEVGSAASAETGDVPRSVAATVAASGRADGSVAVIWLRRAGHGCGRSAGMAGGPLSRAATTSSSGPSKLGVPVSASMRTSPSE